MNLDEFFAWLKSPDVDEAELTPGEKFNRDIEKARVEQTIRAKIHEQRPKQYVRRLQIDTKTIHDS